MSYVVVYDPLAGLALLRGPVLLLAAMAVVFAIGLRRPSMFGAGYATLSGRARLLVLVIPMVCLAGITTMVTIDGYRQKGFLAAGDVTLTEGTVHGFTPVGDHRPARFDIGGVPFRFYGSLGIPIHDGLRLRISHRGDDVILRVEAVRDRAE
jgi:hypothetical protein